MIKIEHIVTPSNDQMAFIIEGMRNPMNSWDKSDSGFKSSDDPLPSFRWEVGEVDMDLMNRLRNAGTDHRKFMRQMPLMMRITAPLYWWKEFDTYKVGTVANSCSTMHKIHEKEFTMDDFSVEHLSDGEYGNLQMMECIITCLNTAREWFNKTKDKEFWWQMIQLLPSSYNQTRNVTMNYEVALNMYQARKNHKLDEWKTFCLILSSLPYGDLITGKVEE